MASFFESSRSFIAIGILALCLSASESAAQSPTPSPAIVVKDYESCVKAGNPVFKSYPGKCITADRKVYIDPSVKLEKTGSCTNMCGNGKCEEITCSAIGCPCAETHDSCPNDCP